MPRVCSRGQRLISRSRHAKRALDATGEFFPLRRILRRGAVTNGAASPFVALCFV
jgi:hypothetical protein